jgi:7-cyano-7-deazaguanine synthase
VSSRLEGGVTVLLLSGGLDSALCLAMLRPGWALAVDYGQPHAGEELACARRLAGTYGAQLAIARVTIPSVPAAGDPAMLWPGRNLVLLSLAAALAQRVGADEVAIGANADDRAGYPDCRREFFEAAAPASGVRISAPLLEMTKEQIGREARNRGVPVGETWSCYYPEAGGECGRCDACAGRDRALGR